MLLYVDIPLSPHKLIPKKDYQKLLGPLRRVGKDTALRWRQFPGLDSWPTPASPLTLESPHQ